MRKTLVVKLKKSGQSRRHVICEITGHSRESSLNDYDKFEIDENQRKELSHIISGFSKPSSQNSASESSKVIQNTANGTASNQAIAVQQRAPCHLFPSNNRARCTWQWVLILYFSLLDFQDSNLVLLPSIWQLSPAAQLLFQHKITRVVRSISVTPKKPRSL